MTDFVTPMPFLIRRMRSWFIAGARNLLRHAGLGVVRYAELEQLMRAEASLSKLQRLFSALSDLDESERDRGRQFYDFCMANHEHSTAQLFQDLLVVFWLKGLRRGYFVEVGAGDGVSLSNTYLLERQYAWEGIVVEPARIWKSLRSNRACHVDCHCIWRTTGETVMFNEVLIPELSTIREFTAHDGHRDHRKLGREYPVQTLSLNDLLARHAAPRVIDFLSIDTEGSELAILEQFAFDRYQVRILVVEHNYTANRERLHELLASKGLRRRLSALSHFDDWYFAETDLSL